MKSNHSTLSRLSIASLGLFSLVFADRQSCLGQDDLQRKSEVSKEDLEKSEKAKVSEKRKYEFTPLHVIDHTSVKSQDSTGTCWSFATASFIEAELIRKGKGEHNISEMFIAYNIYRQKAQNFLLRNGKANFTEGALAHDFIEAAARYGLVPEDVYAGKLSEERHNHGEMVSALEGMLKGIVDKPQLSPKWDVAFDRVLQTYLGEVPERFTYRDKSYSAKEFAESLDFRKEDYLAITSFTHHPFYDKFVLEVPDNFSNGSYHNVPIDELIRTIDHAIENGYSVAWDTDVSERGFNAGFGIAVLPKEPGRSDLFQVVGDELEVTQETRQKEFLSKATTDDHLMHITGIANDPSGKKYYMVKNSWGEMGKYKGYLYASEAFVRMKTIAIVVHRDGAPGSLKNSR